MAAETFQGPFVTVDPLRVSTSSGSVGVRGSEGVPSSSAAGEVDRLTVPTSLRNEDEVLLLGGTAEARMLARRLSEAGVNVLSSLAGGVADPRLPAGAVRVGGFGGVGGLVSHLTTHATRLVVDVTHPFAARMSANAAAATRQAGVPLLRLSRPGWGGREDAAGWHWVADLAEARTRTAELGERPFLALGRQSLPEFVSWDDRYVLARLVDLPDHPFPDSWEVVQARGPFDLAAEVDLLRDRRIDVLLTKDSGGKATAAKLDAAGALRIPVVIIARPPDPAGVDVVATVDAAFEWVRTH